MTDSQDPKNAPPAGISINMRDYTQSIERQLIVSTLRSTGGNISQAARLLETKRPTLIFKMRNLGITRQDWEPGPRAPQNSRPLDPGHGGGES